MRLFYLLDNSEVDDFDITEISTESEVVGVK